MTNLDLEIDAQHRAAQAAEDRAVQVMQRMRAIPGLTTLVDKLPRRFGEPPNPWAATSRNLTVAGLIERNDPALAQYLANAAGASVSPPNYAAQAAAKAKAAEVERMREATAQAAAANAQRAAARDRAMSSGINPLTNRRWGL